MPLWRAAESIDGNDWNYQTGEMIYKTDDVYNFVDGRPYSWTLAGNGRFFGDMLTPAELAEIKTYADGIGPWKPQAMKLTASPYAAGATLTADVNTAVPTSLIADAHKAILNLSRPVGLEAIACVVDRSILKSPSETA